MAEAESASVEFRGPEPILEPEDSLPGVELADLSGRLQQAAARAGWSRLMPVQSRAVPYLLAGRDLMVQSHTGSGKTGAFVLPILERIDPQRPACQALVLVPTRELARQVSEEFARLAGPDVRSAAVYGGVGYGPQTDALRAGATVVIGTPGRVLDLLLRGVFDLQSLRMLILDEADRMLSMGFYPDMCEVRSHLPAKHVHACLFSATFPPFVLRIAGLFLRKPEQLSLSCDHVHAFGVEHSYFVTPAMDRDRCLVRILEIENPDAAIIFCNRKSEVQYLSTVLQRFGFDAAALSSDLAQSAREQVMARLRAGELRFLVATDLAARGIDIPHLPCVIQYAPPEDPEAYVHRTGRTGRAGASGEAITLVSVLDEGQLKQNARRFGIELIRRDLPTDEDVQAVVAQRVIALLETRLRSCDRVQMERLQRFTALVQNLGETAESANLVAMLLDDHYQQAQHARRPLADTAAPRQDKPASGEAKPGRRRRRRR